MRRWLGAGAVLVAAIAVLIIAVAGAGTPGSGPASQTATTTVPAGSGPAPGAGRPRTIRIGASTTGAPVRPGFLGFSFEFQAVRSYTGSNPAAINPVLVQLIRNLTPGQAPVIRIGGDSTDVSWVPTPGVPAPSYVSYRLSPSWLATTAALARLLGARMTMGINLAAHEPALAGAEARAFLRSFGSGTLAALEIGNEPNVYAKIQILHTLLGAPLYARPRDYGYPAFRREYLAEAAALPPIPAWGPALAVGPTPLPGSWINTIPDFLRRNPGVTTMTVHRYPLRNCFVAPDSPQYPSVPHLLAPYATVGLAAGLRPWIARAHAQHRALRVDELNSVACRGKAGVSDVFASALWVTDALFSLVHARVDGVDLHTLPHSAYELFAFSRDAATWQASVKPVYYGLELFAQAAPAGARLLPVAGGTRMPGLSVWATRAPNGTVRTVLINKSTRSDRTVNLRPPAGLAATATIERLRGPSVHARGHITLGGATYGPDTSSGRLATVHVTAVRGGSAGYTVVVPHASAALVTFAPR
ncbi:MAG TPA: glycosyl hydrolase family 79 C-terminal domain-containing protein [Solirubrobacteraceae bacterium]|nr:glycosyl hydrolase family 79 C-terminal domain-containing protein [Solirubrobacteraceae bacterium]